MGFFLFLLLTFSFILFPPTPNFLFSCCYSNHFFSFSSPYSQPSSQCLQAHPLRWVGLLLFLPPTPNPLVNAIKPTHCDGWVSCFFYFLFLPPTPNPLPSGKRALRFARPGFYPPPLLFNAFKPTRGFRHPRVCGGSILIFSLLSIN